MNEASIARRRAYTERQRPFENDIEPLQRLRAAGLIKPERLRAATLRTIASIACLARQNREVTSYQVSQCTGTAIGTNQGKVLENLQRQGLLADTRVQPAPEHTQYRSQPRTVYEVAAQALPLLVDVPSLSDCRKCPFNLRPQTA